MNEDFYQDDRGNEGLSTKRKMAEEEGYSISENGQVNQEHQNNIQSQLKASILREMMQMNEELKYIGVDSFHFLEECPTDHLKELFRIVDTLINYRHTEKEKAKEMQRMSYNLEHEKVRLNRQIEMIKIQVQRIQVDKQELGERTKQMQRQFKTKEQLWQKERENFDKEKKKMEALQQKVKLDLRKENINYEKLKEKYNKIIERFDKTSFVNNFEVRYPPEKKEQLPFMQRECDATVEAKRLEMQGQLREQIEDLREYLRYIFDRLFRIVECNPEQIENKNEYQRCLNNLQKPFCSAVAFKNKVKELTVKIEEMIYKKDEDSFIPTGSKMKDASHLVFAVQKMKKYFNQTQKLEQKRSKFEKDMFAILEKKERLNLPLLEKINSSINNAHEYRDILLQEEMANLDRERELFRNDSKKTDEMYRYLKERIAFNRKQSSVMDAITQNIRSSQGDESLLSDNL